MQTTHSNKSLDFTSYAHKIDLDFTTIGDVCYDEFIAESEQAGLYQESPEDFLMAKQEAEAYSSEF